MGEKTQTNSDNFIQLKENKDILRFGIRDTEGNDTGNYLEFDLEDIELPLKLQDLLEQDKKNRTYLKNQLIVIEKRQDHKGKKLFSANEEAKIRAMHDFYKKEVEVYNGFLGDNGVEKLLNGRKLTWSTLAEIDEIIENTIVPKIGPNADNIKKKIIEKYSKDPKRDDVIE